MQRFGASLPCVRAAWLPILGAANNLKRAYHFPLYLVEASFQQGLLRIDHHINRCGLRRPVQANSLAKASLDSIPVHCGAQDSTDGKSDAQALAAASREIENCHMRREMPPAKLVHSLKVRVTQEARTAGKPCSLCRTGNIRIAVRRESSHHTHDPELSLRTPTIPRKEKQLLTKTGFDGHPLATLGATPRDDRPTSLGLHAGTKSVRL